MVKMVKHLTKKIYAEEKCFCIKSEYFGGAQVIRRRLPFPVRTL